MTNIARRSGIQHYKFGVAKNKPVKKPIGFPYVVMFRYIEIDTKQPNSISITINAFTESEALKRGFEIYEKLTGQRREDSQVTHWITACH